MIKKYSLNNISKLKFDLKSPFIIFLKGDLRAWKTTISKHIINNILWVKNDITSPTYVYYNKYLWIFEWKKIDIFHFDLYRLKDYDEFFAIWWEDIFDNNNWIIIVEWPEILEKYYKADLEITLEKGEKEDERVLQSSF